MKLAHRLSLGYLGVMAALLAGSSLVMYQLVAASIWRQVEYHLRSVHGALVAAAEIEDDGVDWAPAEHHFTTRLPELQSVLWEVTETAGRRIDGSDPPLPADVLANLPPSSGGGIITRGEPSGHRWFVIRERLTKEQAPPTTTPHDPDEGQDYDVVTITVASRVDEADRQLRQLAVQIAGAGLALWLVAAAVGTYLCRRALRPLERITRQVRGWRSDGERELIDLPGTRDEIEELAREFNDRLARIYHLLAVQERFAGEASHQLRTPLTALLGQIDVTLRRPRTADEYRETLATLREQTARLQQIVASLLMLTRLHQSETLRENEPTSLRQVMTETRELWEAHPRAADLRWEGEGPGLVDGSPILLGQLVENLVGNALKYSDPGTPIVISLDETSEGVRLIVRDEGWGMTPEEQARAFEPFFRSTTGDVNRQSGVGLGLSIVQRIAEVHGARIDLTSEPGRGTTVTVNFPRRSV